MMPAVWFAIGLLVLWVVLTGKFAALVAAIRNEPAPPGAGGPAGTNGPGGLGVGWQGSTIYSQPSSTGFFPRASLFGVPQPPSTRDAYDYLKLDSTLPGFSPINDPAVHDFDYIFGNGLSFPVQLPKQGQYKLVASEAPDQTGGINGIQVWETPGGGLMAYLHLLDTGSFKPGDVVDGGRVVGDSGWPENAAYGYGVAGPSNAHLAVITDQRATQWLMGL